MFGNVPPLSRDLLYKISKFPVVISVHTTCTILPKVAIADKFEIPALLLRFFITLGNVTPPFSDLLYKMSCVSCHTMCTLSPRTAIAAPDAAPPPLPLIFFIIFGNVFPPSSDLLCKISGIPNVLSVHTTCTTLPETAIAGNVESPALLLRFFITLGNVLPALVDFCTRCPGSQLCYHSIPRIHYSHYRLKQLLLEILNLQHYY